MNSVLIQAQEDIWNTGNRQHSKVPGISGRPSRLTTSSQVLYATATVFNSGRYYYNPQQIGKCVHAGVLFKSPGVSKTRAWKCQKYVKYTRVYRDYNPYNHILIQQKFFRGSWSGVNTIVSTRLLNPDNSSAPFAGCPRPKLVWEARDHETTLYAGTVLSEVQITAHDLDRTTPNENVLSNEVVTTPKTAVGSHSQERGSNVSKGPHLETSGRQGNPKNARNIGLLGLRIPAPNPVRSLIPATTCDNNTWSSCSCPAAPAQ
jgi:hypothetical protein